MVFEIMLLYRIYSDMINIWEIYKDISVDSLFGVKNGEK